MVNAQDLINQSSGISAQEYIEGRVNLRDAPTSKPKVPQSSGQKFSPEQLRQIRANAKNPKMSAPVKANFRQVQNIQLPPQQLISREQAMLGQLFGDGGKFFGDGDGLPISGTPDGAGRETWRAFGI